MAEQPVQEPDLAQTAPTPVLNTATLAQQVYQHLRDGILANKYLPGVVMPEEALAGQLSVSRAPVREALRWLAAEGLVTIIARQGAVVKALSRQDFLHAYQVREALEVLAIGLAVPRLTPADLAAFALLQQQMRQAVADDDTAAFFAANTAFHAIIIKRSGNDKLEEIHNGLIAQMRRYYLPSLYLRGGMDRSIEEHQSILEALRAGDAEAAAALLSEHIRVPQRILEDEQLDLVPYIAKG